MRIDFGFRLRGVSIDIPNFARPCFNNPVANHPDLFCSLVFVFFCLVVMGYDLVAIVWITFWTSMPVTTVVLKYGPCFGTVPVDRCSLNPPLSSVSTHCVVNVDFPLLGFSDNPP